MEYSGDESKLYPDLPVVSSLVGLKRKVGSGDPLPSPSEATVQYEDNKENESLKKHKV